MRIYAPSSCSSGDSACAHHKSKDPISRAPANSRRPRRVPEPRSTRTVVCAICAQATPDRSVPATLDNLATSCRDVVRGTEHTRLSAHSLHPNGGCGRTRRVFSGRSLGEATSTGLNRYHRLSDPSGCASGLWAAPDGYVRGPQAPPQACLPDRDRRHHHPGIPLLACAAARDQRAEARAWHLKTGRVLPLQKLVPPTQKCRFRDVPMSVSSSAASRESCPPGH